MAVALFAVVYFVFGPKPVQGSKSITINVTDDKQAVTVYQLTTDAEYLRQAMEETEGLTFSGTEGEYGNYGIDTQPVMDGDEFDITYTPANVMN